MEPSVPIAKLEQMFDKLYQRLSEKRFSVEEVPVVKTVKKVHKELTKSSAEEAPKKPTKIKDPLKHSKSTIN